MTCVGAVDLGTNSTRLLIHGEKAEVMRRTVVTGLGRGSSVTGRLAPDGRRATLETLAEFGELLATIGVDLVRAVMTAVGRDATDTDEFLAEAEARLGTRPEVISGEEEARLSYRGATAELPDGRWTVVDIGGGSTEVVTEARGRSLEIGSVKVTDRFLLDRPVADADLAAARAWVSAILGPVSATGGGVVGVAGTWTSMAAISHAADSPDPPVVHHSRIDRGTLERWVSRLARMSVSDTARLPGLDPARAPVILGGAIVAEAALAALSIDSCLVSEHDLLDGIVAGLS